MTAKKHSDAPTSLSHATLGELPSEISVPSYHRNNLSAGIVHIGLGNFHRAHQAWYLHRLMQMGHALDWAIIGAGVRPYDADMRERLLAQDCLTSLIELDPSGTSAEVIGSMIDYVAIEDGNAPLIAAMADPAIRIVSLTVTEGGYYIDPASGELDVEHPDIVRDAENPDHPTTAFGAIVAALRLRRDRGHGPFAAQSCDNLLGNGRILRQTVVTLARLSDAELADWIDAHVSFPNSMVDCIVPATGAKEVKLAQSLGIDDAAPVTHENFRQWVIEDDFCAGRPDWDLVGATFSDRVHDFETMKLRILNAGHQIVANVGEIAGIETISGCMENPHISAFFRKVQAEEIAPHVSPVPGMTPLAYVELIEQRFRNPSIIDTTRRVAFDGSSRHPGFVLPIVRDGLSTGISVNGLALVEALWARMCQGSRENGSTIEPNDPYWADLVEAANTARTRPEAWLEQDQVYGDLARQDAFRTSFVRWLEMIWADGSMAALNAYVEG